MGAKVMVIEDDRRVQRVARFWLVREGFEVAEASSGAEAWEALRTQLPAALVVGRALPDGDGLEFCRRLWDEQPASRAVPVLALGDDTSSERRCESLELGAWDYLAKPIDGIELAVRVRAHLKVGVVCGALGEILQAGAMTLDSRNHVVSLGRAAIALTPNECAILKKLLESPGRAVDVETLLVDALGYPPRLGNPEIVRTHVRNLRQKLEAEPRQPRLIVNLPRIGYALHLRDASA